MNFKGTEKFISKSGRGTPKECKFCGKGYLAIGAQLYCEEHRKIKYEESSTHRRRLEKLLESQSKG